MEVIAAVMIGALLWLIGPGRKFWVLASGTAGERVARRTLHTGASRGLTPARATPAAAPRAPRRRSDPPPTAARQPAALPAAEAAPRHAIKATDAAPAKTGDRSAPPELRQLQRTPITLGVALVLQTLAFIAISALVGVGYVGLEWKARADARAVERRLAERLTALEASLASSQHSLEAMEALLADQARALERIDARLQELAPSPRPEPKLPKPKHPH